MRHPVHQELLPASDDAAIDVGVDEENLTRWIRVEADGVEFTVRMANYGEDFAIEAPSESEIEDRNVEI